MKNLKPVFIREEIIKSIRAFFYAKNFHEVLVPVLNDTVPLEPNLHPFSTSWQTNDGDKTLYLSMSPERGLKRMLGMGMGNCFALGKSFRNLESAGSQHIPEFLMLEWYRENADYLQIMKDAEELVMSVQNALLEKQLSTVTFPHIWKQASLQTLFEKYVGDYKKIINDEQYLFQIAEKKGYKIEESSGREVFDQLFVNEIESKLPLEPFFLVDFPSKISPLCKPQKDKSYLVERFELYINGVEIGNGNTEYTDEKVVRKSFEREKGSGEKQPVDEKFLKALKSMQNKSYAGIGLGVDRLAMLFAGVDDISLVEPLIF